MTVRNAADKTHAHFLRIVLLAGFFFLVHGASAETLVGKAVRVADGDTLTILDSGKRQHKIRLDGIDAPESKQAFGQRSRQSLAKLCAAKAANIETQGKDRYGRVIGRVSCAGIDANAEQVRRGMGLGIRALRPYRLAALRAGSVCEAATDRTMGRYATGGAVGVAVGTARPA